VPVIVHIAGTAPDEVASCCQRLAGLEAIAGLELGLPDTADPDEATAIIQAAHASAGQPLIVRLPLVWADALCQAAVEAGADALTVAAPPRGTMWYEPGNHFITGRLYGPYVLPLALRALRRVAALVSIPLVGCGGIHTVEDAQAFLRAGAAAVQIDGAVWRDPACLAHVARSLRI
jgi:dihydroorotate dehydrogenase (NAD+) catalytic subunit